MAQTQIVELPDNRSEALTVYDIVQDYRVKIINGDINGCMAGVILKKMNKASEELLKDAVVKSCIQEATEKYLEGGKTAKVFGATIQKTAVHTAFDYSECGHTELDALYAIQKEVDARIKLIEAELKLLIKPDDSKDIMQSRMADLDLGIQPTGKNILIEELPKLVWENCGEVVNVVPPKKLQTIGLKYSKL